MKILWEKLSDRFDTTNENFQKIKDFFRMDGVVVAGGAARQAFLNEGFGSTDIDVYAINPNKNLKRIERMIKTKKLFKLKPTITYDQGVRADNYTYKDLKIQLISSHNTYTDLEKLFNTYDFTCCCFAIVGDKIFYTEQAKEDTLNKKLRCVFRIDPLSYLRRVPYDYRILKYVLKKDFQPDDEYIKERFDICFMELLHNPSLAYTRYSLTHKPFFLPKWEVEIDDHLVHAARNFLQNLQQQPFAPAFAPIGGGLGPLNELERLINDV